MILKYLKSSTIDTKIKMEKAQRLKLRIESMEAYTAIVNKVHKNE